MSFSKKNIYALTSFIISLLISILTGYLGKSIVEKTDINFLSVHSLLFFISLLFLFTVNLNFLLIKYNWYIILLYSSTLWSLIVFQNITPLYKIIFCIIVTLIFYLAYNKTQDLLNKTIELKTKSIMADAFNNIFLIVLILIVGGFFINKLENNINPNSYKNFIEKVLNEKVLKSFDESYESNITVNNYLEDKLKKTDYYKNNDLNENLKNKWIDDSRNELQKTFDTKLSGEENLKEILVSFLDRKLIDFFKNYLIGYYLVLSILLLIFLSLLKPIYKIITILTSYGLFLILRNTHVFEIKTEKVDKEILKI